MSIPRVTHFKISLIDPEAKKFDSESGFYTNDVFLAAKANLQLNFESSVHKLLRLSPLILVI